MQRELGVLRVGVLGLGLILGGCDKGEAKPDAAARPSDAKAPATKVADAKAPDMKTPGADTTIDAKTGADTTIAEETPTAPAQPGVDTAPADLTEPEGDTAALEVVPPPTEAAAPGTPPTGPVIVPGGEDEPPMLDLGYEHVGELHLGMPAAEVVAKLGAPKKKDAIEEEGATGDFVQTWTYSDQGLEVGMAASTRKGPQKVSYLRAGPTCTLGASWGLKIGSTRAELEKIYAKAIDTDFTDADSFVAGSIYGGVMFDLKDGKVTSIFIGAGAE